MKPVWLLATASMLTSQTIHKNNPLGFLSLTKALDKSYAWNSDSDRLNFEQLFSGPVKKENDGLKFLRNQYKNYKESYVKYMKFDPEKPNPS